MTGGFQKKHLFLVGVESVQVREKHQDNDSKNGLAIWTRKKLQQRPPGESEGRSGAGGGLAAGWKAGRGSGRDTVTSWYRQVNARRWWLLFFV